MRDACICGQSLAIFARYDQGQPIDRSGTQENKPTDVSDMVASTRAYIIISNPDDWHCSHDWQSVAYHEDCRHVFSIVILLRMLTNIIVSPSLL